MPVADLETGSSLPMGLNPNPKPGFRVLMWHADVASLQATAGAGQRRDPFLCRCQSGALAIRVPWHHLRLGSHLWAAGGLDGQDESFGPALGSASAHCLPFSLSPAFELLKCTLSGFSQYLS